MRRERPKQEIESVQSSTEDEFQNCLDPLATLSELDPSMIYPLAQEITWFVWSCLTKNDGDIVIGNCEGCQDENNNADKNAKDWLSIPDLQEWIVAWKRIGYLLSCRKDGQDIISPFQVHAIASQMLWQLSEGSLRILFPITCLSICCQALASCPIRPSQRVKRWKSLLFETLQLFRRFFLDRSLNFNEQQQQQRDYAFPWSVWFCCELLIPNVWHVRREIMEQVEEPVNLAAATVASAMSILSKLLTQYFERESSLENTLVSVLIQSMNSVMDGRWDLVWYHAWRNERLENPNNKLLLYQEKTSFSYYLSYWSCWRQMADSSEADVAESICWVETLWDKVGIALSAACAHDSGRPWHPNYTWELMFPHVSILLEQKNCKWLAFRLLQSLILATPSMTITFQSTCRRHCRGLYRFNYYRRHDHPAVTTFQLLSEHIVQKSTLDSQSHANDPLPGTWHLLPDASHCYGYFMKQLISKYVPIDQVALVQHLIETFPNDSFKPKFLDLLRGGLVSWKDLQCDCIMVAKKDLWSYLDKLWGKIMESCFPSDDSSSKISQSSSVPGWDQLVDQTELCVSLLSLVRLWCLMIPSVESPPTRNMYPSKWLCPEPLKSLQTSLRANLQSWATRDHGRPKEYFRLNLLENSLEETIPLLLQEHEENKDE